MFEDNELGTLFRSYGARITRKPIIVPWKDNLLGKLQGAHLSPGLHHPFSRPSGDQRQHLDSSEKMTPIPLSTWSAPNQTWVVTYVAKREVQDHRQFSLSSNQHPLTSILQTCIAGLRVSCGVKIILQIIKLNWSRSVASTVKQFWSWYSPPSAWTGPSTVTLFLPKAIRCSDVKFSVKKWQIYYFSFNGVHFVQLHFLKNPTCSWSNIGISIFQICFSECSPLGNSRQRQRREDKANSRLSQTIIWFLILKKNLNRWGQ